MEVNAAISIHIAFCILFSVSILVLNGWEPGWAQKAEKMVYFFVPNLIGYGDYLDEYSLFCGNTIIDSLALTVQLILSALYSTVMFE